MGKFGVLTTEQENEINELLKLADNVLKTDKQVTAVNAGSKGGMVALDLAPTAMLSCLSALGGPFAFLSMVGIGYFFGREKTKKEVQKQQNYVHEIALKIAKIEEQHRLKEEELQKQIKLKDEIIRQQSTTMAEDRVVIEALSQKVAEYECVIEALVKVVEELQKNLSYA